MVQFTIVISIFLSIAVYHFYTIIWKADPSKKHFFLIQLAFQVLLLILSMVAFWLLIISASGHHVDTELETVLGNLSAYISLSTITICIINIAITLFKNFKKI